MNAGDNSAEPPGVAVETMLRDGTPVLVRSIGPDDRRLLKVGMAHLSPQSRYFRFFRPMSEIPPKLLAQFTDIDHVNHEALGALDVSCSDPVPVGVVRYIRLPENQSMAEVALTVVDSHQGRGLGTILLAAIACIAVRRGIGGFEAVVLKDNRKMLNLFEELSAATTRYGAGEVRVRMPLSSDPSAYPETPVGDVFRQVFGLFEAASWMA